jgi:hypothetical protein
VDDFDREALLIEIDFNLRTPRVVPELEGIAAVRGYLKLRLDNGPEPVSIAGGLHLGHLTPREYLLTKKPEISLVTRGCNCGRLTK